MWFELRLNANNKDEFNITDIGNYLLKHHQPFINEFEGSPITQSTVYNPKERILKEELKTL
jgi:hypothetical protein